MMTRRFFSTPAAQLPDLAATDSASEQRLWRLGLIGAGMMGREHLRVAALLGRAEICGIYDPHAGSVEAAQADCLHCFGAQVPVYSSLSAAAGDDRADAYIVATPNYTHLEVLRPLLGCGKPILLEKPMATTLSDAFQVVDLARHHPGVIQLGMQYRFKSQYVEAFRAVKEQCALGRVHTVALAEYRPPFLDKVGQWNKFSRCSGGTLVEKCCHYFDLMNLMVESTPVSVFARGGQAVNFLDFEQNGRVSDIDDHAFVIVTYANGIHASFTLNMFCQELYEELVVVGEKGRLVACEHASFRPDINSSATLMVEVPGHEAYRPVDVTYPRTIEQSGHSGASFFAHRAFIQQLEGEAADSATPEQGLWSLILASAAQASLQTGTMIEIEGFCQRQGLQQPGS